MKRLIVCALLALGSCGPKTADAPKPPETAATPLPPNAATLKGYTAPLQSENEIDNAANVSRVVQLDRDDVKLYSLTGGDPAINGDYAVLGLNVQSDGWHRYRIGDFNTWEVVEQTADKVVLKVSHSAVEDGTGDIVSYEQKLSVALPPHEEGDAPPPKELQVTPVN